MLDPENEDDLKRIVEEKIEESSQEEFKRQLPESGKNNDIAKEITAMANSGGGEIIYGIDTDDCDRASALFPFDVSGGVERILMVVESNIDEPVQLENIYTIDSNGSEGYLVVQVPDSDRTPHFFEGAAITRAHKITRPLKRREIGELFAESDSFAAEFGLSERSKSPAKIKAEIKKEKYQKTDSRGRLKTRKRAYLIISNQGDRKAYNVDWNWIVEDGSAEPDVTANQFPRDEFPPDSEVRIRILLAMGMPQPDSVRTQWEDKDGESYEEQWPVSWQ